MWIVFYPKSTFISVSRLTRLTRLMAGFILTNAVDSPEFDHTILMSLCGMKHCWFFIFVFVFRVCFGFEEYTNFNNSTIQQSTNTKHRLFQLFTFTEQLWRRVLLLHTKWLSFYFNLFSTCLWSCSKFAQKTPFSGLETLKFDVNFSFLLKNTIQSIRKKGNENLRWEYLVREKEKRRSQKQQKKRFRHLKVDIKSMGWREVRIDHFDCFQSRG